MEEEAPWNEPEAPYTEPETPVPEKPAPGRAVPGPAAASSSSEGPAPHSAPPASPRAKPKSQPTPRPQKKGERASFMHHYVLKDDPSLNRWQSMVHRILYNKYMSVIMFAGKCIKSMPRNLDTKRPQGLTLQGRRWSWREVSESW